MSYDKIPNELRAYQQWIGWRLEDRGGIKPTKVPYRIRDGYPASVTNPGDWCEFDLALAAIRQGHYNGIGFVLTKYDPFAFIDLDDVHDDAEMLQRQIKIYNEFESYAERSPSGTGLHIILKGEVTRGRKRSAVEVYSAERYMTMTGDVFRDAPIKDFNPLLQMLWQQMGGKAHALMHDGNAPAKQSDEDVYKMAVNAENGAKFYALMTGNWQVLGYASQSEADFALIDIIAFYTQNRDQIIRIFRHSGLAQRSKAQRPDYVNYMVNRSFDRLLPPIDLDGIRIELETKLAEHAEDAAHTEQPAYPVERIPHFDTAIPGVRAANETAFPTFDAVPLPNARGKVMASKRSSLTFPPGLVGDIAAFIYAAAPRPVKEIALVGAIGFMAGIAGRSYNISGMGLNQYIMLIAGTGTGKEAISSGIDKIMRMVRQRFPDAAEFIGPGEIASPEALFKYLNEHPCIVSIIGEVGLKLSEMSRYNASPAAKGLQRLFLDLYNKSGEGKFLRGHIYSDKLKNVQPTENACFTLVGESTGKRFFEALNEGMIEDGLIPRFTIVEYTGPRPELNEHHLGVWPSNELADQIATLTAYCHRANRENGGAGMVRNVEMDAQAHASLRGFNDYCDNRMNSVGRESIKQLWNRAHVKALKLAALVAVGCNWAAPVITEAMAVWAIQLVIEDVSNIIERFETGAIGDAENSEWKQQRDFAEIVKEYLVCPYDALPHKVSVPLHIHAQKVIPQSYLSRRLGVTASFKGDRLGATAAIKRVIMNAVDQGILQEVPKHEVVNKFQTHSKIYAVTNASAFV